MKKIFLKTLILLFSLAIISFFSLLFYFQKEGEKGIEINFNEKDQKITFSFAFPVSKTSFLSQIKFFPQIEGNFYFKEKKKFLFWEGYKKVIFWPKKLKMGSPYKVSLFGKEFVFSLPAPKVKEISFDEKSKKIIFVFFDPIDKDFFFKVLKIQKCLDGNCQVGEEIKKGKYFFLEKGKKVVLFPKEIEKDRIYKIKLLDKSFSFKVESIKVKKIYFDQKSKILFIFLNKAPKKEEFLKNFKVSPFLSGNFVFKNKKILFYPKNLVSAKAYRVEVFGKIYYLLYKEKKPKVYLSAKKFILVDLSEQKVRLYLEGKMIAEYLASTGRPGMETPTGTFRVLKKEKMHWSVTYGLYLPYALQFYNGYYIHELPIWPGGYQEGAEHLGRPVSHGCVRVGSRAAREIYNFAEIGTKVIIQP